MFKITYQVITEVEVEFSTSTESKHQARLEAFAYANANTPNGTLKFTIEDGKSTFSSDAPMVGVDSRKKLSLQQKEDIRHLVSQGKFTKSYIAKLYGVSCATITNLTKQSKNYE